MSERPDDRIVRIAAFQYLDKLQQLHGDVLPWTALAKGFNFHGQSIPLIGAAGIWKPQALDIPISITTSPRDPMETPSATTGYSVTAIKAVQRVRTTMMDFAAPCSKPDH